MSCHLKIHPMFIILFDGNGNALEICILCNYLCFAFLKCFEAKFKRFFWWWFSYFQFFSSIFMFFIEKWKCSDLKFDEFIVSEKNMSGTHELTETMKFIWYYDPSCQVPPVLFFMFFTFFFPFWFAGVTIEFDTGSSQTWWWSRYRNILSQAQFVCTLGWLVWRHILISLWNRQCTLWYVNLNNRTEQLNMNIFCTYKCIMRSSRMYNDRDWKPRDTGKLSGRLYFIQAEIVVRSLSLNWYYII